LEKQIIEKWKWIGWVRFFFKALIVDGGELKGMGYIFSF
jgi:hypothetical protein